MGWGRYFTKERIAAEGDWWSIRKSSSDGQPHVNFLQFRSEKNSDSAIVALKKVISSQIRHLTRNTIR